MGAREYLEKLWNLEDKVVSKRKEIEWLQRRSNRNGLTEDIQKRLVKYEEESNQYIDEMLNFELKVTYQLMELEDFRYRMILRERYLYGKKWQQIAEEQYYSERTLHNYHEEALKEFGKIINK